MEAQNDFKVTEASSDCSTQLYDNISRETQIILPSSEQSICTCRVLGAFRPIAG